MMLHVNGVSFQYKSAPVLDNIHFNVSCHEVVAILGPRKANLHGPRFLTQFYSADAPTLTGAYPIVIYRSLRPPSIV